MIVLTKDNPIAGEIQTFVPDGTLDSLLFWNAREKPAGVG